jgi:hypothetical protein
MKQCKGYKNQRTIINEDKLLYQSQLIAIKTTYYTVATAGVFLNRR